jgi:hypothetical protein
LRRRIVAAFATACVAGCAVVIDLGDPPMLRSNDAAPVQDASVQDSAPDGRGAELCGLERSFNNDCARCIEAHCCQVSIECGQDPACREAFECIKDCMGQIGCLNACFALSEIASRLGSCSAGNCDICSPKRECIGLGACGRALSDAGQQAIFRNVAKSDVLVLDEANCKARLEQFKRDGLSDAAPCR